jgi:hypothetical protein
VDEPDPPIADLGTVARVRDALAGGKRALGRDRDVAAYFEERFPGVGKAVTVAHDFHRRAAMRAVTGQLGAPPAAAVIFASCGLPSPAGALHASAVEAVPRIRVLYADSDPKITETNRTVLARPDPGRVAALTGRARCPQEILGSPQAAELLTQGPVSVQVILVPHRWPPDVAREAVAGYAELLPPGSTLCLSLGSPDRDPRTGKMTAQAREFLDLMSLAGGPAYPHFPEDVASWVEDAGMLLNRMGVADAREFGRPAPSAPLAGLPGRVIAAAGIVP